MGIWWNEGIKQYSPNATKCLTWQDVKASHETSSIMVITMKEIYGMMILLTLGLRGAMAAFLMECLSKAKIPGIKKTIQMYPN